MKKVVLMAIIAAVASGVVPFAVREAHAVPCAPLHKLFIMDLDVIPDPVHQGQPVQGWKVTLRSDYNGECGTRLVVMDRDQIAGTEVEQRILPGVRPYAFKARPGYRFQTQDHCHRVLANIGGTPTPIAQHGSSAPNSSLPGPPAGL